MVGRRRTTRWWSSQKTLADPFSLFYAQTTAYFNAETGTTNWDEMWQREEGEETQPKFDCRRTGESIAFFFVAERANVSPSFVFTRWSKVSSPLLSRRARCELIVVSLFPRRTGAREIFSRQYHVRSRAARDEENGRRGEGFSSRVWTRLRSGNVELDV